MNDPIYDMSKTQMTELLNAIADKFSIGRQARTPRIIMANIENSDRRSHCLSRIEDEHTVIVEDEDGEYNESALVWGEEPDDYIDTYRGVIRTLSTGWVAK